MAELTKLYIAKLIRLDYNKSISIKYMTWKKLIHSKPNVFVTKLTIKDQLEVAQRSFISPQ